MHNFYFRKDKASVISKRKRLQLSTEIFGNEKILLRYESNKKSFCFGQAYIYKHNLVHLILRGQKYTCIRPCMLKAVTPIMHYAALSSGTLLVSQKIVGLTQPGIGRREWIVLRWYAKGKKSFQVWWTYALTLCNCLRDVVSFCVKFFVTKCSGINSRSEISNFMKVK